MTTITKEDAPLTGVRMFSVEKFYTDNGPEYKLQGKYKQTWNSSAITAMCRATAKDAEDSDHLAKMAEAHLRENICTCGIYVVQEENRYHHGYWRGLMYRINKIEVEAKVSAYGICIEGTNAYRCQYATIEELTIILPICSFCSVPAEYMSLVDSINFCQYCWERDAAKPSDLIRWDELGEGLSTKYSVNVNVLPLIPEDTLQIYGDAAIDTFPVPLDFPRKVSNANS